MLILLGPVWKGSDTCAGTKSSPRPRGRWGTREADLVDLNIARGSNHESFDVFF